MKIVIDIPKKQFDEIQKSNFITVGETYAKKLIGYIKKGTPLEQEPKTGHWIAQDIHNCHTDFKCSECDYIHSFMHLYGKPTADYTYCPNCGCRMVEPQESEEV